MFKKKNYAVPFLLLAVLASGCATYPISKTLRDQASKNLTFQMALENPDAYTGSTVIWGGIILETKTLTGASEITILETPLQGMELPSSKRYSPGRFIARTKNFLDPEIYSKNKKVTIGGKISGKTTMPLGDAQYTYPVLEIEEIHLWKQPTYYRYEPMYYWWYDPWGFEDGFYMDFDLNTREHFRHRR
jgi:outer membrane lipoprotein